MNNMEKFKECYYSIYNVKKVYIRYNKWNFFIWKIIRLYNMGL